MSYNLGLFLLKNKSKKRNSSVSVSPLKIRRDSRKFSVSISSSPLKKNESNEIKRSVFISRVNKFFSDHPNGLDNLVTQLKEIYCNIVIEMKGRLRSYDVASQIVKKKLYLFLIK